MLHDGQQRGVLQHRPMCIDLSTKICVFTKSSSLPINPCCAPFVDQIPLPMCVSPCHEKCAMQKALCKSPYELLKLYSIYAEVYLSPVRESKIIWYSVTKAPVFAKEKLVIKHATVVHFAEGCLSQKETGPTMWQSWRAAWVVQSPTD